MANNSSIKVAVAGATGLVGSATLDALLKSTSPMFDVTILSRSDSAQSSQLGYRVVKIDYDDHDGLVKALKGQDILISTVTSRFANQTNEALLEAAISADVPRFFPSEFSFDVSHPAVRKTNNPMYKAKVAFADKLEKAGREGKIRWTIPMPSQFLDMPWLGLDVAKSEATLWDGGRHKVTGCSTDFTGAAVARAAAMTDDSVINKRVPIAELQYSGLELLELFEQAMGKKFEKVTDLSSEEALQKSAALLADGREMEAYKIDVLRLNYDGSGCANLEDGLDWGKGDLVRKSLKSIVEDEVKTKSPK